MSYSLLTAFCSELLTAGKWPSVSAGRQIKGCHRGWALGGGGGVVGRGGGSFKVGRGVWRLSSHLRMGREWEGMV